MVKGSKRLGITGCCAAAFLATSVLATPTCDDATVGEGCINLSSGGSGVFEFSAMYGALGGTKSGSLRYVDTAAGFEVNSNVLVDYSDPDTNMRGFIFAADGGWYNEVRVIVWDNGSSGDTFEIQLHGDAGIVYQEQGILTDECGGGIAIMTDCEPEPEPEPEPDPGPKPRPPRGNNGVGNGEDPQPPGNPPINDGPGTGPGNPGNRGGARR